MNSINFNNLKIIKADTELLSTINFDCGDEDLNEFLLKDSFDNINNKLSIIFLCYFQKELVGFFTLSADSIKINNKLKINYRTYPAVKIGRFAVSKDYQNQSIGSLMINWIIGFCRYLSNYVGIRFLSVDAYNNEKTIRFYENNLFVKLESVINKKNSKNIPMYRDLCEKFI